MASESGRVVGGSGEGGVGDDGGDGFGEGGPHAVEGERRDHGGQSALLLATRMLPPRRTKPGSPASRELPEIERCSSLDRVLAPRVRFSARIGAVGCWRSSGGRGDGVGEDNRDGDFLDSGGTLRVVRNEEKEKEIDRVDICLYFRGNNIRKESVLRLIVGGRGRGAG